MARMTEKLKAVAISLPYVKIILCSIQFTGTFPNPILRNMWSRSTPPQRNA